jgi:hypothetical protein
MRNTVFAATFASLLSSVAALGAPVEAGAQPSLTSNKQPVRIASTVPIEKASGPQTEAGLRCLLGLEPEGCEARFENPSRMRKAIRYCAGKNWHEHAVGVGGVPLSTQCLWGALESIEYLGTDAAGDDVYSTKFMHTDDTHILPQPGSGGKIARDCWVHGTLTNALRGMCSDGQAFSTSSVKVTSSPDQARILYSRSAPGGGR